MWTFGSLGGVTWEQLAWMFLHFDRHHRGLVHDPSLNLFAGRRDPCSEHGFAASEDQVAADTGCGFADRNHHRILRTDRLHWHCGSACGEADLPNDRSSNIDTRFHAGWCVHHVAVRYVVAGARFEFVLPVNPSLPSWQPMVIWLLFRNNNLRQYF